MTSAVIFDCEGARLSADEKAFFREVDPWGFIVFARHCESAENLHAHCDELRDCVGRADVPILIDQEGGRVARLAAPTFPAHSPAGVFGELYRLNPKAAREAAFLNGALLGRMVSDLGVNVNCIPMLDVPQIDADPTVIGDRAIAKHPDVIIDLSKQLLAGSLAGGAAGIIKHIPGHGRALCDSHEDLPSVCASKVDLETVDFVPFKAFRDEAMAMTAHVVYEAFDADRCATLSPTIIKEVIRGQIGFGGLLMGDDLKMKALGGPLAQRAADSIAAGCDLALCCNFSMAEKRDVMAAIPKLENDAAKRAERAVASIPKKASFANIDDGYKQLASLLKPVLTA